jgi:hypothetical protein
MKRLFVALSLGVFACPALADVGTTLDFPTSDFFITQRIAESTIYDFANLKGCAYGGKPSEPMLPVKTVYIAIPASEEPAGVVAEIVSTQEYVVSNSIYPTQYPIAANGVEKEVIFALPNGVYAVNSEYPGTTAQCIHNGFMGGYRIATVSVHPVQYNPVAKKLTLATKLIITLKTKPSSVSPTPVYRRTTFADGIYRKMAQSLVSNPAGLSAAFKADGANKRNGSVLQPLKYTPLPSVESDEIPYIIITEHPLDTVFQRLADYKTRKGLPAIVKTAGWINANYPGIDLPDKMRNFIRDCYSHWGTVYVLLGGGPEIVPCRYTRNFSKGYTADAIELCVESIPCDLYYSDLDGTWNTDGDNYFGEGPVIIEVPPPPDPPIIDTNDIVDMYPEVFVGRASVLTVAQAQTFVRKVMAYETNSLAASSDFSRHLAFWGGLMDYARIIASIDSTTTPYDTTYKYISTPTDTTKKYIINQYLPSGFRPDTLFNRCDSLTGEITRNLNKQSALAAINDSLYNIRDG